MVIYKTTNLINGKIYIGKKSNMKRFNSYFGSGIVIKHAIKKYGIKNFSKEILQECSSFEELNDAEKHWIKHYNSIDPVIGYNRSYGGDGFSGITKETIEKIRQKHLGSKRSKETCLKISESRKGMRFSEEHLKNLSIVRRKRVITEETRKKTSNSWTDKMKEKQANRYKKIIICLETGIEYSCAGEAAEKMGLSRSSIYHNLHGRNKSVKKYTFKFKEEKRSHDQKPIR